MWFVLFRRNRTHVSVSIHTSLAWNSKIELRCIPLIILQMFLQPHWTPSVANSVDWTWFGKAHACLYKVPQLAVRVRAQSRREVEGIVCRSPRHVCLEAQIGGRVQKPVCSFKGFSERSGLPHPQAESRSSQSWPAFYTQGIGQEGETMNFVQRRWFNQQPKQSGTQGNTAGTAGALRLERSEVAGRLKEPRPSSL